MALTHQIQKPEATEPPVKPSANKRKQAKLTVSDPANLVAGLPCPCCGQPVKWDRNAYQRAYMRKWRKRQKEKE